MRVEHMGGKPAVHLEMVRCSDALIKSQSGNPKNFCECGFVFGCRIIFQAHVELMQDRILAVPSNANNEGHRKLRTIRIVESMEALELIIRQPVEPRARLLGF